MLAEGSHLRAHYCWCTHCPSDFRRSCSAQSCWGGNLHSASSTGFPKCFQHSRAGFLHSLLRKEPRWKQYCLLWVTATVVADNLSAKHAVWRWVIPSPGRPRQEGGCKFEASFSYKQTKEENILKTKQAQLTWFCLCFVTPVRPRLVADAFTVAAWTSFRVQFASFS